MHLLLDRWTQPLQTLQLHKSRIVEGTVEHFCYLDPNIKVKECMFLQIMHLLRDHCTYQLQTLQVKVKECVFLKVHLLLNCLTPMGYSDIIIHT